jgi:hypothetical protein
MSYRADLDALSARHDALASELAAKTREVDEARRLLDDAIARTRLPVLPNINIASPCTADWNKMTGDERVRACADCNKNVYNLSDMTRDEAEALIIEKEGKLCVRYYQRKDCTIGVVQKRKRRLVAAGAAAMLAGVGVAGYQLTRTKQPAAPIVGAVQSELVVEPRVEGKSQLEAPPPGEEVFHARMGDIAEPVHVKMGAVAIHHDDELTK